MSALVESMINSVMEKHYRILIWDLALCDSKEDSCSYHMNVMSDTDIIAIWVFSEKSGIPESALKIEESGTILCTKTDMICGYYEFIPLK